MASMQVKDIGSMLNSNAASGIGKQIQSSGSVSFEAVWNNRTDKNNLSQNAAAEPQTIRKEEDVDVRDSLKLKESSKPVVKESQTADKSSKSDIDNLSPQEWDRAMEVLGAAATELIQQIAETFDMTVEEVQGLMDDLGIGQLDVLQQDSLGELLLAAAGADSATSQITCLLSCLDL